jgi:outer membrane protein assembly factor BamB
MRVYKILSFSVVILLITVVFAGAVTVPGAAQYDTMQFHCNAQHTGNYSTVAGSIPSNGQLLWNYTTGGLVASSPAVANGVVYVGSEDNNVYALNATTGAQLWNYTTGGQVWSSPAVANGAVYVGSDDNNTYALNATTGAKLWNYTTGNSVFSSPAVANGTVYVGSVDGNVYAIGNAAAATSQSAMPGFDAVLALVGLVIVGLIIAAYVVKRRS